MNASRFFFFLSVVFFALFLVVFYQQNSPQNLSFAQAGVSTVELSSKQESTFPTGIVIPSIHVWLPVYPAALHNGNWETTIKGVSYLTPSATVGGTGNAVFYGHDWPNLLGGLKDIRPGDIIQIISKTGKQIIFEVSTVQEVNPTDVSVLAQTTDSRITLYTCSGIFDSKRLVVVAIRKAI